MINLIKQLFELLSSDQRKRFYKLQLLVIAMAIFDILGVASIAPFMALVGDAAILDGDNLLASMFLQSGAKTADEFIVMVGFVVLAFLTVAALLSMFTVWKMSMFAANVGAEISDRLYRYYMQQSWLFHANSSSAQLTKQVSTETVRVTDAIIQPLMQLNAKLVLAAFMSIAIFIYNPLVAVVGLFFFGTAYVILYKLVRTKLHQNGQMLSDVATLRFRLMNEGFGGIKDVLLLGRKKDFLERFSKSGEKFARSIGTNVALGQVPRYFMELLAFGSMIGLVLYLLISYQGDLGLVLPVLSVYALAAFKLLPAFQQIYSSIAQIKGNSSAFESIKDDLVASKFFEEIDVQTTAEQNKRMVPKVEILLDGVSFTYPNKTEAALKDLSLKIPANNVIGIVGPSGSGKSTVIDVLLSLIEPQKGQLLVDGKVISDSNRRSWQNSIGFVPQSIFLSEGTIAENVAFGIPKSEIDLAQVERAINLAHLDQMIRNLSEGIHSKIGERGVQLSGGQRQRIGIARALYHDASVLVFDEATSALDGITEKIIMEAIHDFSGEKTIIMVAHRLKTVQQCDILFLIDQGQLIDKGTYQELLDKNESFREMALHA